MNQIASPTPASRSRLPARPRFWPALAHVVALAFVAWTAQPALAQSSETGAIRGRVQNADTGDYLNNARVYVEGTSLQTFTNSYGEYRLSNVPPGEAAVQVSYTGLTPKSATVTVRAGETAEQDFNFSKDAPDSDVVTLTSFEVTAAREIDPLALAVNEQRHSANLKSVISTEQFGAVTEGNIGEFAKYLAGVNVDYVDADARTLSLRGLPPNTVAITVDGNRMASASSSNANRTFEFEQVSLNNLSRVEVMKVPTPDSPADAIGGSINLVSKSAFERSRPEFRYRAYTSVNSEAFTLGKTAGPFREPTRKTTPGFDFTYLNPVSRNFGIAINGLYSEQFNVQQRSQTLWARTGVAHTITAAQAAAGLSDSNPFLRQWQVQASPKVTERSSVGIKADWRLAESHVFSAGVQYNRYKARFGSSNLNFEVGTAPVSWNATTVQGAATGGNVTMGTGFREKFGNTIMPTLDYRFDGRDWKIDGSASYSKSVNHYRDFERGFVENISVRRASLAVRYDDIVSNRVGAVSVGATNPTPFLLSSYNAIPTLRSSENDAEDVIRSVRLNFKREFDTKIPFSVKFGGEVRDNTRDIEYPQKLYTVTLSQWPNYGAFVDPHRAIETPPFGLPTTQWISPYLVYDFLQSNPAAATLNTAANQVTEAQNSKYLNETVSSAYLRFDTRLLNNRLFIVGGTRFEKTEVEGTGVLTTATASIKRGLQQSDTYDTWHPSLNAVYGLTDSLQLRFGYARTIARPDFGFIVPSFTESATNSTLTVTNPGLKPWTSDSFDISLEYYTKPNGIISVGVFRKDIENFFTIQQRDNTPENLAELGIPPSYADPAGGWDIIIRGNTSEPTRVTGMDFDVRQELTFLPSWADGISVFANGAILRLEGPRDADFTTFVRKGLNWGLAYKSKRVDLNWKWNYRGEQRNAPVTGANLAPDTYEYLAPRLVIDADVTLKLTRWLSFFAAVRNLNNTPLIVQRFSPVTPDYAKNFRYNYYGSQWTFGVKGRF